MHLGSLTISRFWSCDNVTGFLPAEIAGALDPDSLRFLNIEGENGNKPLWTGRKSLFPGRNFRLNYAIRAFEVGDPVVVDAISRSFGGEKIMPSIIDEWLEEGRKEGLQKGLQKGREEGQRKTIEKLLAKGVLSVSEIASILEVNPQWVERIRQELEKGR
ncbi:MAG: hypothetical protein ACYC9S_09365 [Leptospirales bacterium]